MNRRRVLIIATAAVLALFGMFVIVAYVSSADRRAQEGTEMVGVLVAANEIPANTPARELSQQTETIEVPQRLRQDDAVQDLRNLGEQVTTSVVRAGDQIVRRQFGDPDSVSPATGGDIAESMEVLTIALEPQRAAGGRISAGDLVSVIVSVGEANVQGEDSAGGAETLQNTTQAVLSNVPVSAVSGGVSDESGEAANAVLVSLEVDASDAERIVFGMEFGQVWLTVNGENVPDPDTQPRSPENIYDVRQGGSG